MSPADDPFVGWGGESDEDGDPAASGPGGPVRRRRWSSRFGRNVVVFIVILAAVLSLAASLARIGPWAPSAQTTPALGTTSPAGPTPPNASTSQTGTTSPPGSIVGRIAPPD